MYAGLERAQKELGTHESIPIGAIPAGSGNAISVSLAEQSREVNDATTMALLIAKGQTIRLDGARLEIYRNDENSNNDTTNHATKSNGNGGKRRLSLDRRNGSKKNGSSSNNTNDTNNRIAVYQNTALLSVSWGFFADVDLESERFRCLGGTRFILQAIARLINLRTYKMDLTYRVSQETNSVCERLEKSLPGRKEGEFRTIKDENILGIWAMNLPWGSGDTKSAPLASPSDGFFDIIIVHPTSKLNLLKLLLDFDTKGSHAKNEAVTYLKTSEFVLTLLGRSDLTKGVSCSTDTPAGATTNIANPLGCMDAREDPETPSTTPSDLYEGGRVMIDGEVVPDVCSREDMFTVKGCVERGLADVLSFAPSCSYVISAGGSIACYPTPTTTYNTWREQESLFLKCNTIFFTALRSLALLLIKFFFWRKKGHILLLLEVFFALKTCIYLSFHSVVTFLPTRREPTGRTHSNIAKSTKSA